MIEIVGIDWLFIIKLAAILEALAIGVLLYAMAHERDTAAIWKDRYEAERADHRVTIAHADELAGVHPRDLDGPTESETDYQQHRMERLFGWSPEDQR